MPTSTGLRTLSSLRCSVSSRTNFAAQTERDLLVPSERKKYVVRFESAEAEAAFEAAVKEDRRTINEVLRIGAELYLGSRNNYRIDANMTTTRVLPGDNG